MSDRGEVTRVERSKDGALLEVATDAVERLRTGDSVSVSGVCLTATEVRGGSFVAQATNETLSRSSLEAARPGLQVNLELPLRAGEPFGGHLVQGHVDGVGKVVAVHPDGFSRRLEVEAPDDVLRYLVVKGSVAVDGVSLTVVEVRERSFTVALIPETLQRTTLGGAVPGVAVNLEVDILAKYVERFMAVAQ